MYSVATQVAIYTTTTAIRLYLKNRKLRQQLDDGVKIVKTQSEMIRYMIDCMERYEIPFDEFDAIAFEAIAKDLNGGGA